MAASDLVGGINTYGYVEGNPINKTDPTGLAPGFRIPGFPMPIPLPGGSSGGGGSSSDDSGSGGLLERSIPGGGSGAGSGSGSGSGAGSGSGNCPPDDDFCRKRKQYCITFCQYELDMHGRRDNFGPHRRCIRKCMNAAGCNDF